MSKVAVANALAAILTTSGLFADVSIGERKDYENKTPVAAVVGGDVEIAQQALPDKWRHADSWTILVYVSYEDQGAGEVARLSLADALITLFEGLRRLGGAPGVIQQMPRRWTTGYAEIGDTIYLRADLELWVWEEEGVSIADLPMEGG